MSEDAIKGKNVRRTDTSVSIQLGRNGGIELTSTDAALTDNVGLVRATTDCIFTFDHSLENINDNAQTSYTITLEAKEVWDFITPMSNLNCTSGSLLAVFE